MLRTIRSDLRAAKERDPAARSSVEVALCYPGLHAIWSYRLCHWLWQRDIRLAARALSALTHALTGVDIHPGAVLGDGLFIDHATGVVIGETAEVGAQVTLYQGVTLGGTSLSKGKRHPTVGDRVTIGAGAKVLGPITIGHDSRIGANAVVVRAVPTELRGRRCAGPGDLAQPPTSRHDATRWRRDAHARPGRKQPAVTAAPHGPPRDRRQRSLRPKRCSPFAVGRVVGRGLLHLIPSRLGHCRPHQPAPWRASSLRHPVARPILLYIPYTEGTIKCGEAPCLIS